MKYLFYKINAEKNGRFHMQIMLKMIQNIISGSEHKCASEKLRRKKQKMSTGKKTIEEKQTILLESMQQQDFLLHS